MFNFVRLPTSLGEESSRLVQLGRVCRLNQLRKIGHGSVFLCRDSTLTLTLSLKGEGILLVTSALFMVCKHALDGSGAKRLRNQLFL